MNEEATRERALQVARRHGRARRTRRTEHTAGRPLYRPSDGQVYRRPADRRLPAPGHRGGATLTPERTTDVDSFEELEEHYDDELSCLLGDAPATVRLVTKCCHRSAVVCETHRQHEQDTFERLIVRIGASCRFCESAYVAPDTFDHFVEVIPL